MPRRYFIVAVIFMFTLVAAGSMFLPARAFAASLYFSPAAKTVTVGDNFTVTVNVSSPDQAMNAASGDISFPTGKLRVLSVSNAGSAMNLWVQNPSFTNAAGGGNVSFAGVVLNPGFLGTAGNVITIRLQALAVGSAPLKFAEGSVLANDGNGTNILTSMSGANITIVPATATPTPAPTPAPAPAPAANLPPAPFVLSPESTDPTDPQPMFAWSTTSQSGIARYLVKIGDGDWFDASTIGVPGTSNTYRLPLQAPKENVVLAVDAYDAIGGMTEATTTFSVAPLPAPVITEYSKEITAAGQLLTVEGTSRPSTTVKIYLERSGATLTFLAPVDTKGNWSIAQKVTAASGVWTMKAQAIDVRGAVSSFTPDYAVAIGGWLGETMQFLLTWGAVIILGLLLLAAIVALAYYIIHRLRRFHLSLSRDLVRERKELRDDLKRIEKELEADQVSSKIDLSAGGLRKKQERVRREIEHLEDDLKRDIKENG